MVSGDMDGSSFAKKAFDPWRLRCKHIHRQGIRLDRQRPASGRSELPNQGFIYKKHYSPNIDEQLNMSKESSGKGFLRRGSSGIWIKRNSSKDKVKDIEREDSETRLAKRARLQSRVSITLKDLKNFQPEKHDAKFFASGRDFASVYTNHQYTTEEKEILSKYDSLDYLPSHSEVYREWLKELPARLDWDRWVMMAFIGFSVGVTGFMLHQITHLIAEVKWHYAEKFVIDSHVKAYLWVLGYSLVFASLAASTVAYLYPSAAGSGIPEIIGFLNGTAIRYVLNFKAFIVKFFSCACAVGSGMPVGPEGPMIHMGGIIGSGLSQCKSRTFRCTLPFFERFRNPEDRRNFTSAGAGAGVAAAFSSPVGGLLFAMEEVSSFWSDKMSWMTFFCCMVATFTADFFNTAFGSFKIGKNFGLFQTDKYILFQVTKGIPVNVIMFIPAVALGVLGGLLGSAFTIMNVKICRTRIKLTEHVIKKPLLQKTVSFLEPILITVIFTTISVYLPIAFDCKANVCPSNATYAAAHRPTLHPLDPHRHKRAGFFESEHSYDDKKHLYVDPSDPMFDQIRDVCNNSKFTYKVEPNLPHLGCKISNNIKGAYTNKSLDHNGHTYHFNDFNEISVLLNVPGADAIRHLFSRQTHLQFDYIPLLVVFPIYFIMACWAAGSSVSSGFVVPMLFIGGVYGRIVGRAAVDIFGETSEDDYWRWVDPGAFALIGAASFFGGVSRLTMSLTVIMIELTNDVLFLLPIMVTIMVSKWVADYITHPLYHSLLELKCMPFLPNEPVIVDNKQTVINLEQYQAQEVMASPVCTIKTVESVKELAQLLTETDHGGFPVVTHDKETDHYVSYGIIGRTELYIILCSKSISSAADSQSEVLVSPKLTYQEVSQVKGTLDLGEVFDSLNSLANDQRYQHVHVNLSPFINKSAPNIDQNFSLHRTYLVFRTLGLRHLTVVDRNNRVVGMITRKDLMGYNLEKKLDVHGRNKASKEEREEKLRMINGREMEL
ncbi:unnamed protein product [Owenia fusiformis]|uniref:Chloride channel protein n=1 Tax=Owenia fusiformis TaxID=6347 RepID=A0A8J1U436_OWEFU|nr:unnamed protein product [Owenia fusiformis]